MKTARRSTDAVQLASSASLRLDDQLCFALYAATNVITRAYRAPLAKLGLTYPQYLAMLVLWEHGDQTVKSLAERLDLDSSTITPLVKRLAAAGLVHRSRHPADQRNLRIELTGVGHAMRARAALIQERVACQTHLGPDEFVALRAQLHRLVHEMTEERAELPLCA
ncbi:MAG: MarR family transcriptional regulator [Methylibium sp.]|uniref:MarR family winged helix-turn-helix transcriptional regulator n=1 Tax=Methylibium sp. TaxID=2067992 RepID=UPI0018031F6D|nr:MarR family transcriptional regulator [Methylibium sp.]MBA3595993.1 MarR family transcriptional regulator [Methylibium sp.]